MKSGKIFILTVSCLTLMFMFYSSSATAQTILRMASLGQKGISAMIYLDKTFFPTIEKVTDNEVKFDVYWGGIMGDEEDYLEKMRIDQLQGGMVTASGGITEIVCPDMAVLELPFLFNPWAWDEVKYVQDNIRDDLYCIAEKNGYKILIWLGVDFDQLYSTKHKIDTLENLQKSKLLTWFGPLEDRVLKALGVSPVPVNVPEVVSSMKTGITNVAISPSLWWVGAQLYTDTKYVNPLPLRYVPGMIVLSMQAWNRLSAKNREAITKVIPEMEQGLNNAIRECNEKSYNAMLKYGIEEVHLSKEQLALFKEKTRPVWDEMAGEVYSKEILEKVQKLLKEYRSKKAGGTN